MDVQTIYSLPLSKLTDMDPQLDEAFFTSVVNNLPQIGKELPTYYLINNNFTLQNPNNSNSINIYNNFVIQSQRKGQLLQLLKNLKHEQGNTP
jgi:hypothetical protein